MTEGLAQATVNNMGFASKKTAAAELDGFLPSIGPFPDAVSPLFKDNDDLTQKDLILLSVVISVR